MKVNPADEAARAYLDAQKKNFKKPENILTVAGAALFALLMLLLFFLLPKSDYSKHENRKLAEAPTFSVRTLEEGKYKYNRYEFLEGVVSYLNDHFPFRDGFMELNGVYDLATLRLGSGGVILGSDGYLLDEERPASDRQKETVKSYAQIVSALAEKGKLTLAVAGKGGQIMTGRYPAVIDLSAVSSNLALVDEAFADCPCERVDLMKALSEHDDQPIYYRTDHHWTTLGAYYGASAILRSFGIEQAPLEDYTKEVLTSDFRGTLYNRSGLFFMEGEELYALRYEGDDGYTVTYCDGAGRPVGQSDTLYDLSALSEDHEGTAYDCFVAPVSTPVVRIEKEGERRTLLVLKDSFAHSALPFLARYFNIITVDIRRNADYALSLIEEGKVDRTLVLVNTETLFG